MDPNGISEGAKGAAASAVSGIGGELVKIGKTAIGQMLGKQPADSSGGKPQAADDAVADMKQKDDKFSEQAQAEVRAKINSIYAEYAAKRKKEEQVKKQQEATAEKEEKRLEEIKEVEQQQDVDPAIAKTRAEVGKNFGAE